MEYLPACLLIGVLIGGIYALVGLGVVTVYKVTNVFNFAVGEIVIFGGLIAVSFMSIFPVWIAILATVVVTGLVGFLIQWGILGRFIGGSPVTAMMVTAVLTYFFSGIASSGWGDVGRPIPAFLPEGIITLGGAVVGIDLIWSSVIAMVVFGFLFCLFRYTKLGLGMRASAEDSTVAESKGIPIKWVCLIAWIIAGITAALGGIFMGYRTGVAPSLALIGLKAFPVVFLGGLTSVGGVLIGGITIGVAEQLVGGYVGSDWMEFVPFLILLAVLLIRPQGILGAKIVARI